MNGPEQIRGPAQILQSQLKEQPLARIARERQVADGVIVEIRIRDGLIKNRRIRGQPGDRQVADVARERAAVQQLPRDLVEPQTLSDGA